MKKGIQSLQVLRAIGCITVIMCHTLFTDFGQTGVDFFLIISGFVIMYSTDKKGAENFWIKRIKRIIPLYWSITIFTALLVEIAPSLFNSYEVSMPYLLKSLFFIPYYHNGIAGPIMALGWTLNYEMFFYLVFWLNMKFNYKKRAYTTIFSLFILVLLGYFFKLPLIIEYWFKPVILEFAYGILLFIIFKKFNGFENISDENKNIKIFSAGAYILLFLCIVAMEYFFKTQSCSRAFSVAPFVCIIVLFFIMFNKYIYSPNLLIKIGNRSYEIYLLHIFCVRTCEMILSRFIKNNFLIMIIDVIFSIFMVMIFFRIIEKVKLKILKVQNRN